MLYMSKKNSKPLLWMFAPIFFGVVGGIVAWKVNKETQKELSRVMLVAGIAFTLVIAHFYIWLFMKYF